MIRRGKLRLIYFARRVGTEGPIKIGCSSCPIGRCKQLGCDIGAAVEVIAEAPGNCLMERNVHIKFSAFRVAGPCKEGSDKPVAGHTEWFAAAPELLAFIKETRRTGSINIGIEDCRERAIAARYKGGETLEQIATTYSLTRERIRQILDSIGVPRRSAAERAYVARLEREERMRVWREEFEARRIAA